MPRLQVADAAPVCTDLIQERVRVQYIGEQVPRGLEMYIAVVFPSDFRTVGGARRRGLLQDPDRTFSDAADTFKEWLEPPGGAQEEANARGSPLEEFGPMEVRDGVEHFPVLEASAPGMEMYRPLEDRFYANFDWTDPDIYFGNGGGGSGSESNSSGGNSTDPVVFEPFTLVLRFETLFAGASSADYDSLLQAHVQNTSALIAQPDEYVKVLDDFETPRGLELVTAVILPVWSEGDISYYSGYVTADLKSYPEFIYPELQAAFGPLTVTILGNESFPGLPDARGQAGPAVPLPPGYWYDIWSGFDTSTTRTVSLVLTFDVEFTQAVPADAALIGPYYVEALAAEAGLPQGHVLVPSITANDPEGLVFATHVVFPSFEEEDPAARRRTLLQGDVLFRESATALARALSDNIQSVLSPFVLLPAEVGETRLLGGSVEPEDLGAFVPPSLRPLDDDFYVGFDWVALAAGNSTTTPDFEFEYDYVDEEPVDNGPVIEDTVTLIVGSQINFYTASACDFLDPMHTEEWYHWVSESIIHYFNQTTLSDGLGLHSESIKVTVRQQSGAPGPRGDCDTPILANIKIATRAFVPNSGDESEVTRARDGLKDRMFYYTSTIFQEGSSSTCTYINCGLPAFTLGLAPDERHVNFNGEPYYFPGPLIETSIDGGLAGPGQPGPAGTPFPTYSFNDTAGNETDPAGGPQCPGPGCPDLCPGPDCPVGPDLCPGPNCPGNIPNGTEGPDVPGPTQGGGNQGGGSATVNIPVVFFSIYFPTFWQNYTSPGSDEYFAYFYSLEAAIVALSGLPDTLVLVAEDDVAPGGYEVRAALYYAVPDYGITDAEEFLDMGSNGGLTVELNALMSSRRRAAKRALQQATGGLYEPGEVIVQDPDMVMLPYNPTTGLLPTLEVGTPSRPTRAPPQPDDRPEYDYDDFDDYGNETARPVVLPPPQTGGGGQVVNYIQRPLSAVAAFFVRFPALNYNTLASTPGAGEQLCDFHRDLVATLALVSPENVQIVSVFEMEDGSGHTEIFTRVLLGGIVVEQVEGEPTLEVEPETLTEDEALLDVYAAVENLEDSLPTAQLLAMGGWEHPLLQLGTVEVTGLRVPRSGVLDQSKLRSAGWWAPAEFDSQLDRESNMCSSSELSTTPPPSTTPSSFFEAEAQNLEALFGDLGLDFNLLVPSAPAAATTPEPLPDIFSNLNFGVQQTTQPPTQPPTTQPPLVISQDLPQTSAPPLTTEAPDTTPPYCQLKPLQTVPPQLEYIRLRMYSSGFVDPRAECFDTQAGGQDLPIRDVRRQVFFKSGDSWVLGSNVQTTLGIEVTYKIVYQATDAAGLTSAPVERIVEVVDQCKERTPPSLICNAETKAALLAGEGTIICSVPGLQSKVCDRSLVFGLIEDEGEEEVVEEVTEDKEPPTVRLNKGSDGREATLQLADGGEETVVVHTYTVTRGKNIWVDPGFEVFDNRDKEPILKRKKRGALQITTAYPIKRPYEVFYYAEDAAGLVSAEKRRLVYVNCPVGEIICPLEDGQTEPSCSVTANGQTQCGENANVLAGLTDVGLNLGGDTDGDSSGFLEQQQQEREVEAAPAVTKIECGFSQVNVVLGVPYTKCPDGADATALCERGCKATYGPTGPYRNETLNVADLVEACPNLDANGIPRGAKRYFSDPDVGLKHCKINTRVVGDYPIQFCVQPVAEDATTRKCFVRAVKVSPSCDIGEVICSNGVECSVDGQCLGDIQGNINTIAAGEEATTKVNRDPAKPDLRLLGPEFVQLPRGTPYRKCDPEDSTDVPSETNFCDRGATATDQDFDYNNITIDSQITVCPPEACHAKGSGCAGHEFSSNGKGRPGEKLKCARVNEMAPIGTEVRLRFFTLDYTLPSDMSLSAEVFRTISIVDPCKEGQFFCEDDRTCSDLECDQREKFLGTGEEDRPPVVRLVGDAVVRLKYKETLEANLRFCATIDPEDSGEECGAVAVSEVNGEVVVPVDTVILSPSVTLEDLEDPAGGVFPGVYAMRYKAYDADGRESNTVLRIIIVEAQGEVVIDFDLPLPAGTSAFDAEVEAEKYRSTGFDNEYAAVFVAAFENIYALTGVSIRQLTVEGSPGALFLRMELVVPVSSTAVDLGDDTGTTLLPTTPPPTTTPLLPARRRQLLQAAATEQTLDDKLAGVLSTVAGTDSSAFASAVASGAEAAGLAVPTPELNSAPSSAATTPAVDVMGGLITKLAAAIVNYEEQYVDISFRMSQAMVNAAKVLGNGTQQAEDAAEQRIKREYRAMLLDKNSSTEARVGNLTAILRNFDAALALQLAFNSELSTAMEAIQEGLAQQAAFLKTIATTQEFLESVIGPDYAGQAVPPPCPQALAFGTYRWAFPVVSQSTLDAMIAADAAAAAEAEVAAEAATGTEAPPGRRRLAQDNEGGRGSSLVEQTGELLVTEDYFGYRLVASSREDTRAATLEGILSRDRFVGGPNRNRVLGGVLLHQTRMATNSSFCDESGDMVRGLPGARFSYLATVCLERDFLRGLDSDGEFLARWEAQMADPAHPYGSDPIWIRSSSLFQEALGGAEGNFYNMTPGSPEVNDFSGAMYAHFPREVPGKETGFPIFIESALDEIRLAEMLVYTEDSNYMDSLSQGMTMQLGVYNPTMRVFGYGRADVTRDVNGVWEMNMRFNGLAAMDYDTSTDRGRAQALADNLAIVMAAVYLVWFLVSVFSHPSIHVQVERAKHWAIDLCLICAMAGALVLYYQIVGRMLSFTAQKDYTVYDALTFAPARYFLPAKVNVSEMDPEAITLLNNQFDESDRPADWALNAGQLGRWELPDNNTGLSDYGAMMDDLDWMSDSQAFYGALQGIIVMVMIFRMLHLWNFQSQVGTVTRTLFAVLPELGEFAIVLGILMVLYASYGIIVAGAHVSHYTNLPDAFYSLFVVIVAGDGGGMHDFAHRGSAEYLSVEYWNMDLWYFSMWIFFFFTLTSYLLGIIGFTLAYQKEVASSGSAPSDEISMLLKEHWEVLRHRAPANRALAAMLEPALDGVDNGIDLAAVLRKQLKLDEDDVRMTLVHTDTMRLDHQDLEQSFFEAHNRALRAGGGDKRPAKLTKADAALILRAVNSVMGASGTTYSVDLEYAEDLIANMQHDIYKAVLAAVTPVYEAAAGLWDEQVGIMEEMEAMSAALCRQARARGDSSMTPFVAPKGVAPSFQLSFKERTSDPSDDNIYAPKGVKLGDASPSNASTSSSDPVSTLKKHMASAPPLPPQPQESGLVSRLTGALSSAFAGVTGGSTRRVQRRPSAGSDGESDLLE